MGNRGEAELAGDKRTILDIYLNWTPALALGVFFLVWLVRRQRFPPRCRFFSCGRSASQSRCG